jgi:outer membrane protein assembly factor BamB
MTRLLLLAAAAATFAASAVAATSAFPSKIDLPDGFQPEGVSTAGERFYVGSIPTGAVYSGSLRTGTGAILVPSHTGRSAIGLKADRGRLFVAGGNTGLAFVYNAKTGKDITSYQLSSGGSFINDVVVTKSAAWFTDSFKPVLYRVPLGPSGRPGAQSAVKTVQLSGDYQQQSGFNVNGIDATANGKTLVIVQSGTGKLFTVAPTGVAKSIALAGGESVPSGDGVLLDGKTLYVVQNQLNVIAKISLAANLRTGRVLRRIANPGLDVPTTIAELGSRLYAVNARFNTPATPTTDYWITQLKK